MPRLLPVLASYDMQALVRISRGMLEVATRCTSVSEGLLLCSGSLSGSIIVDIGAFVDKF